MRTDIEESLREASALGNTRAVLAYLNKGPKDVVNAQNATNGWTPLMWACSRGHKETASELLRHGASLTLVNAKGQTAIDLATGNARELFEATKHSKDIDGPASFVPNYIRNPDLTRTWGVPDSPIRAIEASHSVVEIESQSQQVVLFKDEFTPQSVLGAILVSPVATWNDVCNQIADEMDNVPNDFQLLRHESGFDIPIHKKQLSQLCLPYFHPSNQCFLIVKY